MKVKATELGFYGTQRRREGDVFEITSEKHFSSRWMEKVEQPKGRKPKAPVAKEEGGE